MNIIQGSELSKQSISPQPNSQDVPLLLLRLHMYRLLKIQRNGEDARHAGLVDMVHTVEDVVFLRWGSYLGLGRLVPF